jgi:CubicO group peptidase (beta-lactamase class C family)
VSLFFMERRGGINEAADSDASILALVEKPRQAEVGYQFVVSFNGAAMVKRAGGMARRAPDVNPRAMTNADKFNVASVSKKMTAIAAMKPLHQKRLSDHHRIKEFLPPSFELAEHVDRITFRRLLTHRSGIRCQTKGKFEDLNNASRKAWKKTTWRRGATTTPTSAFSAC